MTRIALGLEYPLMQQGGTEVLVRELLKGLSRDFQITLVSGDRRAADLPEEFQRLVSQHLHWDPQAASPATAGALAEALRVQQVRLAHFHFGGNFGWSNRFPGRCPIPPLARLGVPVATTIHMAVGLLHGYCGPQKPLAVKLALLPLAWLAKLRVLRHVRREIAVSRQDHDRLRRWYWPARDRFHRIYHSRIDVSAVDAAGLGRKPTILSVGHVAARKGQPVLAEAFALIARRFPDWSLRFAGQVAEADCQTRIEAAARRCARPDQIQLLGRRDDTTRLMQEAAVFVQPSFYEGLPLSLQEALYYGCACLATAIPGNIELVEDQVNGLLVPPGNPEALAKLLERLLGDESLRRRLAAEGRPSVVRKEMTAGQMIEKHRQLYAGLVN